MASTTREQRVQYAHDQHAERVSALNASLAALPPDQETRRAGLVWHLGQAERVRDLRLALEAKDAAAEAQAAGK